MKALGGSKENFHHFNIEIKLKKEQSKLSALKQLVKREYSKLSALKQLVKSEQSRISAL